MSSWATTTDKTVIDMGSNSQGPDEWEPFQPQHDELFVATVSERADEGSMCSISPVPWSEQLLEREWVAATEGSFVALEEMR